MFAPNRMGLGMRPSHAQYSAPPAQTAPVPGMTTLFVGSISPGITDDFLTTLFSACGQLRSFKRLLTPIGKPQGFGFAEFDSPEAMVRAIELLNGQELPSLESGQPAKKLLVRADAKTGDYLSAWQSQRIKTDADDIQTETSRTLIQGLLDSAREGDLTRTLQSVEAANNANATPVSAHLHDLQEADLPENQRGLVISEIALFRERAQKRDKNGEPIKIAGVGPVNAANRNNPNAVQPPTGPSRGWGQRAANTPTGPAATGASPAATPVPASPAPTTPSSRPQDPRPDPQSYSRGGPEFVKGTPRKTDEERDRESRANKARADEAEFRQRERVWEQNEYKRLKKLSHQVALENATRDAEEKDRYEMKTRLEIWDDDESDELFYTDRIKWRANRARQLFSENRADADSRAIDAAEEERVRRESELFLERQMETIRATQEEQKKAGLLVDDTAPLKISVQVATSKPEKKVEDAPKVVFGQEEDDDTVIKKRRVPLIELDFAMDKEKAAEKLESIRTQVTKDKDTLWKAKVRWEAISDAMIDTKLDAIVKRKIIHYLGDNDEDLAMFVNEHLKDHKGPGKLVEGLEPVLDADATEFVIALWRQIIFESVAYGEGLETRALLVD